MCCNNIMPNHITQCSHYKVMLYLNVLKVILNTSVINSAILLGIIKYIEAYSASLPITLFFYFYYFTSGK